MNRKFLFIISFAAVCILLNDTAFAGSSDLPFAGSLESFANALSGKVGVAIGTISLFAAGITYALTQGELSSLLKSVIFILIGVSVAIFGNMIITKFVDNGSSGNLIVYQDYLVNKIIQYI